MASIPEKEFVGLHLPGRISGKNALIELMRMNDQEPVETAGWTF
jgi:hypothetical protein